MYESGRCRLSASMATVQLQKTKSAGTVIKTAIDQKQSLEVVQTMLHGSVCSSSLIFLSPY